jgi:hypothetical protein
MGGPHRQGQGLGGSVSVFSGGRFSALAFATHGITPLGYAAFGFALGVTAGVLIRRAVPAMAVTLAIFAAVQITMPLWVRPHLISPDQTIATTGSTQANLNDFGGGPTLTASIVPGQPGAWIISSGAAPPEARLQHCLDSQGIREVVTYQPASRYWPFQLTETGIFLAFALALAGFCFRRLGRRLS